MDRNTSKHLVGLLRESQKDIRIWKNGHIYYRIDGSMERVITAFEEGQTYIIRITWVDKDKENETEIPMALVDKISIQKNINLSYWPDPLE